MRRRVIDIHTELAHFAVGAARVAMRGESYERFVRYKTPDEWVTSSDRNERSGPCYSETGLVCASNSSRSYKESGFVTCRLNPAAIAFILSAC